LVSTRSISFSRPLIFLIPSNENVLVRTGFVNGRMVDSAVGIVAEVLTCRITRNPSRSQPVRRSRSMTPVPPERSEVSTSRRSPSASVS